MIALTRRSMLQSSAAVGFMACAPAIITTIKKEESVLSIVLRLIEKEQYPEDYHNPFLHQLSIVDNIWYYHGLREMDIQMNTALLTQYPNLFSPCDQVMDRLDWTIVTRALKTQYTLGLVQDLKAIAGLDAQEELLDILSEEFMVEFIHEKNRLANRGMVLCQYIPIQMVRAINPNTFQPYIGAKTRYAMKRIA
jgi:hypothetical protein